MPTAFLLLLLPLLTSGLRFLQEGDTEPSDDFDMGNTMATPPKAVSFLQTAPWRPRSRDKRAAQRLQALQAPANASNETVVDIAEWPDKWAVSRSHGDAIAQQLDAETLFNFTHAFSGAQYDAQTIGLPAFGIPAMKMQYAVPGWKPRTAEEAKRVTAFPSYLALASTWDEGLVGEVATAIGQEFKTLGANVMLGPEINIHRSTQHEEEFDSLSGEDPTLGSVLVRAWALSLEQHGIMSVLRFLGRAEQTPAHFENSTTNLTMWDIYYPPFQAAIDYGAAGVMCANHETSGLWACRDKEILERDLKGIMGFQGMVMSEPGGAKEMFPYASAYERGLDMEWDEPERVVRSEHMIKGMRKAASRVIGAMWRMKFEQHPGCQPPNCTEQLARTATTQAHKDVAKRAAGSAIILLKNDNDMLPLSKEKSPIVAVVGPAATKTWHNSTFDSPFQALAAHGADVGIKVISKLDGAEMCLVMAGSYSHAAHWMLDKESQDAIEKSTKVCKQVAVFMEISGAVETPWRNGVQAIAAIFHAGEETAFAWAATLFGDNSPSGKLPIGLPDIDQDVPEWWTEQAPSYWEDPKVAFPFGHGLSYAKFEYAEAKEKPKCKFPLCLIVTVKNVHPTYSGSEVVQVYFSFAPEEHHHQVLRGFHKTKVLKPGESQKIFFKFSQRDVSLYHDVANRTDTVASWPTERKLIAMIGSSCRDIQKTIYVSPKAP